ncbi:MAG: polysaccharide lyase family 1 protein [Myxococcota bacterium]
MNSTNRTRLLLGFILLVGCGDDASAGTDGGNVLDAATDSARADAGENADADAAADAAATDCSAIEESGWSLCEETPTSCAAVFTDGAGCDSVCAAVGLPCAAVYEDVTDACAPDLARPALSCDTPSGHGSDYCVCGVRECGDGVCNAGESCGSCAADCGECTSDYRSLVDDAVGFATPTGGREGPRVFVTTLASDGPGSLRDALRGGGPRWISFEEGLDGTIDPGDDLSVPADVTLDGRGASITLAVGLRIVGREARNIVIHNLRFDGASDDAVQIRNGADQIWVDHCTFENWGDGAIDITNGVEGQRTNVTVSWNRILGGSKAMLISATSDPSAGFVDENLYVTHHHNYFEGVQERMPRARFAKVHHFNNLNLRWSGYAVGASTRAQILVENNLFDAGDNRRACWTDCIGRDCDFFGGEGGAIRASGNIIRGEASCETAGESTVLAEFPRGEPPYAYDLEAADDALRERVRVRAGWLSVPLPE